MELSFTKQVDINFDTEVENLDPGWYAATILDGQSHTSIIEEPSFKVNNIEYLKGGTNTIQKYLEDPFCAFALGRLRITKLNEFSRGVSPLMRGNLVHASLARLFYPNLSLDELKSWSVSEIKENVKNAADFVFADQLKQPHDTVQKILILYEKKRTEKLMLNFIADEVQRNNFEVMILEKNLKLKYANLELNLKVDRIDKCDDGSFHIIDYKTGIARKILDSNQDIKSIQLFVYAAAFNKLVSTVSFVTFRNDNEIVIDSVSANVDENVSNGTNDKIKKGVNQVYSIIKKISDGDNRIHVELHSKNDNPYRFLHVLSRIKEYRDEYK